MSIEYIFTVFLKNPPSINFTLSYFKRYLALLFFIEDSVELNENTEICDLENSLINPLEVLQYKKIEVNEKDLIKIKNGSPVESDNDNLKQGETVILTYENQIVSIANVIGTKFIQKKVLL